MSSYTFRNTPARKLARNLLQQATRKRRRPHYSKLKKKTKMSKTKRRTNLVGRKVSKLKKLFLK